MVDQSNADALELKSFANALRVTLTRMLDRLEQADNNGRVKDEIKNMRGNIDALVTSIETSGDERLAERLRGFAKSDSNPVHGQQDNVGVEASTDGSIDRKEP